jgi:hypothetical protein
MTDSDLLDSLLLQRPEPQGFVNVNLNVNEEPYGVLISWLSAVLSLLPYVIAVLHAMMKHG